MSCNTGTRPIHLCLGMNDSGKLLTSVTHTLPDVAYLAKLDLQGRVISIYWPFQLGITQTNYNLLCYICTSQLRVHFDDRMSTDHGSIIQCTPFTMEKMRWWFNVLDVNKDGSISEADFHLIASRYVQEYQLEEADTAELSDRLVHSWRSQQLEEEEVKRNIPLISKMADDLRAGLNIAQDDFLVAFEQLIEHNSQLARSTLENMVAAFFDVFDYDQDNHITQQEFVVAMRCFGLEEPEVAETVFVCMGGDQDGRLGRQEYIDGWLNFLLGQDKDHALVVAFAPHLRDV